MNKILLVSIISLSIIGCASPPYYTASEVFSVGGYANGGYRDIDHFVLFEEQHENDPKQDRLRSYVSYLLEYRGINEVSDPEDAEYFILVEYVESGKEQHLKLVGFSKRVYNAIKEIRPGWVAISKHTGRPTSKKYQLGKHVLALRDVVGSNPSIYQSEYRIRNTSQILVDLVHKIEGVQ